MFKNKRYIVKIPKFVSCFYNKETGILILKTEKNFSKVFVKVHIEINKKLHKIFVTNKPLKEVSNNEKKVLKAMQGLVAAKIKLAIFELSESFCKKLKFVGVGYRAIAFKKLKLIGFSLKLGLSHSLYLNPANKSFKMFCSRYTKLYVYGTSYSQICQVSAVVRSYKLPEPYKGKGILYMDEKINIKEGKKI